MRSPARPAASTPDVERKGRLVGGEFGVDAGLYLLPRGSSSITELIRGAPLGDTVDVLVARNVFPDVGEWFENPTTGHWYSLIAADTFEDAEGQAVALGGHLVTVDDAAEQEGLYETFGVNPFVIGLNDIEIEGDFIWTSGAAVTYTNWCSGEPSDAGPNGEDIVHMGFIESCWNDVPADLAGLALVELDQAP